MPKQFSSARPGPPIWIAWERQRRSLSMADRLGARLMLLTYDASKLRRYPLSAWHTVRELRRSAGGTVFVQNPSQVLAALAALLKGYFAIVLVVDRHSNFVELESSKSPLRNMVESALSNYSVRRADLTIVTNRELSILVQKKGGRPFVLPDPFPLVRSLTPPVPRSARPFELLFVASWSADEPIAAAIELCRRLGDDIVVRITGRVKPDYHDLLNDAPANFVATGFISDDEYFDLMSHADAVLAVTTRPATLTCGAYEAVTMGKPMVLGDSPSVRDYFDSGAVYTDGTPADLEKQVRVLMADLPRYREQVQQFHSRREKEWDKRLKELQDTIRTLSAA